MPSPYENKPMQHDPRWLQAERLMGIGARFEPDQPDLATEVRALRNELAELRADLKPVPSLILTGQQVAAEFKRLAGERP